MRPHSCAITDTDNDATQVYVADDDDSPAQVFTAADNGNDATQVHVADDDPTQVCTLADDEAPTQVCFCCVRQSQR